VVQITCYKEMTRHKSEILSEMWVEGGRRAIILAAAFKTYCTGASRALGSPIKSELQ